MQRYAGDQREVAAGQVAIKAAANEPCDEACDAAAAAMWTMLTSGLRALSLSIAVPPPAASSRVARLVDASAYARAKRQATSESWPHKLEVDAFLSRAGLMGGDDASCSTVPGVGSDSPQPPVVLDVRAPCEYEKGHLPGAVSFPLFDDDERAEVGTLYKQRGHDVAVSRGIEILDAKAPTFLDALPPRVQPGDELLVYCKRGGMRSGGMAWLLSQGDLRVHTLEGGYQGFRAWANATWQLPRRLVVLGGKTGSGKTDVLHALRRQGAQILDLEGDARHRGSAFGALGRAPQPSNQAYENALALQWRRFDAAAGPVYIEDESRNVGSCSVPDGLWGRMRDPETAVLRLEVPTEARVQRLVGEYGVYEPRQLQACVRMVQKRLGEAKADELCALLDEEPPALARVAEALLVDYYDAMYDYQAGKRTAETDGGARIRHLRTGTGDADAIAQLVLQAAEEHGF